MTILKQAELIRAEDERRFATGETPFWNHLQVALDNSGGLQYLFQRVIENNPDLVFSVMAKREIEREKFSSDKTEVEVMLIPYTKTIEGPTNG